MFDKFRKKPGGDAGEPDEDASSNRPRVGGSTARRPAKPRGKGGTAKSGLGAGKATGTGAGTASGAKPRAASAMVAADVRPEAPPREVACPNCG